MWNKLTHFVKPRPTENDVANGEEQQQHEHNASGMANSSVMSQVYEQHPNLSVFRSGSAINLASPSTSPPASPSKGSRRSMFKRSLKAKLTSASIAQSDNNLSDNLSPGPALKLVPKKLRASLQIDTFTAQAASSDLSSAAPTRPTSAPLLMQPQTPTMPEHTAPDIFDPLVEVQPTGTDSIRSILRDPKTPGTGRSVRFFSRDAYRVITPDASEAEIDQDAVLSLNSEAFLEKLKRVSPERDIEQFNDNTTKDHCMPPSGDEVDMFSPPSAISRKPLPFQPQHPPRLRNTSASSSLSNHSRSDSGSFIESISHSHSSLMIPAPPADMPNLFDVSQEISFTDIPASIEGSLNGNAITKADNESGERAEGVGDASMRTIGRSAGHMSSTPTLTSTPIHGRVISQPRNILSPEGSVFHSMTATSPEQENTMYHSFTSPVANVPTSGSVLTPDTCSAQTQNATVFFTPNATTANIASFPSKSHVAVSTTDRITTDSPDEMVVYSEEELVTSLRGQLLLQQQLTSQFEVDLAARDELVSLLSTQLQNSEAGAEKYRKEVERRQTAMRVLRRKVGELEKICRGLEEEVERSREESFERSVMDEASEGALVVLHSSIGQLKGELEKAKEEETKVREERDKLKEGLDKAEGKMRNMEEVEGAALRERIEELQRFESKAQQDSETIDSLRAELDLKQGTLDEERQMYDLARSQWVEEKARLHKCDSAQASGTEELRRTLGEREEELRILRGEVEAQWEHAEKADEKIKLLEGEKEGLAKSVRALEAKVEEVGSQWKEVETKNVELRKLLDDAWAAKEELERERDQLVEDLNFEREHAEELAQTLQEQESKLDELDHERQYAIDDVSRLEELLRQRDTECTEAQSRIVEREREAELLRAETSRIKRDHGRLIDEQTRHLDDFAKQEKMVQKQLEEAVRQKAEDDVALRSTNEQLGRLDEEIQRLKRQVHDLQQESADKEVKIMQLNKARAADKDDIEGLNIALDSKQQELELLKRKNGVKGTGGATPAPTRVGLPLHERRQSAAFVTPRSRPSSATGFVKPSSVVATTKPSTTNTPSTSPKKRSNSINDSTPTVRTSRMGPPVAPASASSLGRSTSITPDLRRSITSSFANSTTSSTSNINLSQSTPAVARGKSRSALPAMHRRSSSVMSPPSASIPRSASASRTTSTPKGSVLSRSSVTPGPRSASVLSRSSSVMSSTPEDDKENAAPSKNSISRRSMVPA